MIVGSTSNTWQRRERGGCERSKGQVGSGIGLAILPRKGPEGTVEEGERRSDVVDMVMASGKFEERLNSYDRDVLERCF